MESKKWWEHLKPFRLAPDWKIVWNKLRDIEPDEVGLDDDAWLYTFVQDMTYIITEHTFRENKKTVKHTLAIDLGWYPEGDINGCYHLAAILDDDWKAPILEMETRSTKKAADTMELWMFEIFANWKTREYSAHTKSQEAVMIRPFKNSDLQEVMEIWLHTNLQAHSFIPKAYWKNNYDMVQNMLPKAELYVCEDAQSGRILGFIGLTDQYIAGIFVREDAQSKGIGKQLLDHVKAHRPGLSLNVYQKNERAVRFYQRERFAVQSEQIEEITGEKELVMVWESQDRVHFG